MEPISILYPKGIPFESYIAMPETSWHDLGMDLIIEKLSNKTQEKTILKNVMYRLNKDKSVSKFRMDVFEDIYLNKELQNNILKILDQVHVLQDYMSLKRNIDKNEGIWTLTRRLKEIHEYILCIEQLETCLTKQELHSEGLLELKKYVHSIQSDCGFTELKKDIEGLRLETKKVKSVTLGVNLNEDYEATSMGIVSLNDRMFNQANVLSSFHQKFSKADSIQQGTEWNGNYTYQPVTEDMDMMGMVENASRVFTSALNPLMGVGIGLTKVQENQPESSLLDYLSQVANKMMSHSVRKLKEVLSKYATININEISGLIPEFTYYILWAKYIEQLTQEGYSFHKPFVNDSNISMEAKNIYNLKLATLAKTEPSQIIGNDLNFDNDHSLYILTGANRGGKTTITQAIGQLFVLAQGGIYVAGDSFVFDPVDQIFTHFPADEDKTMDYGRLGEECSRFKEIYHASTRDSLILLNETFSTTSFEEGYYIASDAIQAILKKGSRTIYNTHMHKLARDIDEFNQQSEIYKASSMIVKSENGKRSYKVEIAPAQGVSFAKDIAQKYGVTLEQLLEED